MPPYGVDTARETIQRLAGIPEAPMRRAMFYRQLLRHGVADACVLVDTLVRDTLHKRKPAVESYAVLIDPDTVLDELGPERLELMVARARQLECYAALLWLIAPTRESVTDEIAATPLLHKDMRDMSLGHRRSLARRARGDAITKLISDPDPVVVGHLLANPSTTEQQVLMLCSRRPTVSQALEVVIDSPWICRYRIKAALVQNPYLTVKRATVLLPLLTRHDLGSVAQDATLNVELRESAQHLKAMWNEPDGTTFH